MSNSKTPMTTAAASHIQGKPKISKRGLRLEEEFYVNLDNVCAWSTHPEHIQLQMSDQNLIDIYLNDTLSSKYGSGTNVEINELKRIEREIADYMGG